MTTFLEIENHIFDRLKAVITNPTRIYTSPSFQFSIENLSEFSPAIHIIYDGYSIGDMRGNGLGTVYLQRWIVAIAVKNVRNLESRLPARKEVSEIIDVVLNSLNGFRPINNQFSQLKPINSPVNAFDSAGILFLPFAYEIALPINVT